jgi:murein DD-endopeptidase MepM/ murein hydrolase activator NlpD
MMRVIPLLKSNLAAQVMRVGRSCLTLSVTIVLAAAVSGCRHERPNTDPVRTPADAMGGVAAAAAVDSPVTGGVDVPLRADSRANSHEFLEYLSSRELMVPVDGVRVAAVPDNFSAGRGGREHNAHDIMARRGTNVLAADDGRVIRLANNALGGLTIYATDPNERLVYYYAHLDGYEAGLTAGARIRKGDVIGFVGSTGNASPSAPHLHFQVARLTDIDRHWDGIPVDAREYFVLDGKRR